MSGYNASPFAPVQPVANPSFYYEMRQQSKSGPAGCDMPRLRDIADPDRLASAFFTLRRENGQAPGPDRITYSSIGRREVFEIVRPLAQSILAGNYRPAAGRHVQVPKTGGRGFRTLTLRNIFDRAVAKTLNTALTPFWENIFANDSYGFRPKRCNLRMLARLEVEMHARSAWALVSDDIKGAFDHVQIDSVLNDHRRSIDDSGLLQLIETILRGGDDTKKIGMDQGTPYMPTALNVHLHHVLDQQSRCPGEKRGISAPWLRYADNVVAPCQSVTEGQQVLNRMSTHLAAVGLSLKGENDGQPVDLQHGGVVQLLGFTISKHGEHLRYKARPGAWDDLRENLIAAHDRPNPTEIAHSVISGWIGAFGPALHRSPDRLVGRLLRLAVSVGFREIHNRPYYVSKCKCAYEWWQALLRSARNH